MQRIKIQSNLIAPCGMDCAVCLAYLRDRNPCHGCRNANLNIPKTRVNCKIRTCRKHKGKYCYACKMFPCDALKHLNKRYREKYNMSEIENLEYIRKNGIQKFLIRENKKYISEKGTFCVHNKKYY